MVKILVPTDYSKCSHAALNHAASLAQDPDRSLLILHVVESGSTYPMTESERLKDPLHQELTESLNCLTADNPSLKYEERWIEGIPATAILDVARDEKVDMIVMGTSGRTGIKRLILGSVAEEVCRKATCPVLTIKVRD
jgi:universal stress protein A